MKPKRYQNDDDDDDDDVTALKTRKSINRKSEETLRLSFKLWGENDRTFLKFKFGFFFIRRFVNF